MTDSPPVVVTTVAFNDVEIDVEIGVKQFSEFDDWVRRRFAIESTYVISYHNSKGQEIIPGNIHRHIIVSRKAKRKDSEDAMGTMEFIVSSGAWDTFAHFVPILLVLMFAGAMMPEWQFVSGYMLEFQQSLPFKNMTGPWVEKAYVGFLSWSVTYLFIRRALNPETTAVVVKKYSADAIFGGLAAAGAVIIKAAILK